MISVCLKGWWQGGDTEKNRPFPERDQRAAPDGGRDAGTDTGLLQGGADMDIQRAGGELPDGERDKSAPGGRPDGGRKAAAGCI